MRWVGIITNWLQPIRCPGHVRCCLIKVSFLKLIWRAYRFMIFRGDRDTDQSFIRICVRKCRSTNRRTKLNFKLSWFLLTFKSFTYSSRFGFDVYAVGNFLKICFKWQDYCNPYPFRYLWKFINAGMVKNIFGQFAAKTVQRPVSYEALIMQELENSCFALRLTGLNSYPQGAAPNCIVNSVNNQHCLEVD